MLRITSGFMVDALSLAAFSHNEETKSLLGKLLEMYQIERKSDPDSLDKDMEVFWNIIGDIVNADARLDKKSEIRRVCLKVKNSPIGKSDPSLVDTIEALLMDPDGLDVHRIEVLKSRIRQWISMCCINKDLKKVMFNCNKYNPDDMTGGNDEIFEKVLGGLREVITTAESVGGSSKTIDIVNMTDKSSLLKSMTAWKTRHEETCFPTGLQGLNRIVSRYGGYQRGKLYVYASLSHNYKSGILMDSARWLTTLTKVQPTSPGRRPCVLFISLENEVPENTLSMMKRAYTNAYHEAVPENMTDEQLIDVVKAYYEKNGSTLLMLRKDDQFGYSDLVGLVEELEQRGYDVFAVIIDYLTLMRVEAGEDNLPKRIQRLAHSLHDFAAHTNRIVITAVQLSGEADILAASGQTNIVKRFSGGHLSDSKAVRREADTLIFIHIETSPVNDRPYLTFAWNKSRDENPPAKEDCYCAYPFINEILGLVDDYGGQDKSCRDIFAENQDAAQVGTVNPFADLGASKEPQQPQVLGYGASPAPTLTGEKPDSVKKDISEVLPDPVDTPEESKNDNTPEVENGVVMIA